MKDINIYPIKIEDKYGNDKYGYIDKKGKIVIKPKFKDAQEFLEGLAAVEIKDKWGYIDKTGKVVIEPKFYYASGFSEGLAAVKIKDRYGFIDKTGKIVIKQKFEVAEEFSEGLAVVEIDDKCGFIDKTGKIVIEPEFDYASKFSEGLAAVGIEDESGYIDIRGEIVIELKFDDASDFSEGLAKVEFGSAYIDKTGRYIWNPFKEKEEEIPVPEIPAEENRLSIYFSTLEKIYSKHGSFLGAGEEESRKIGQKINASHGFDGMVYVCESIRDELGQVAYRQLEAAWDGIGKWRG